MILPRGWGEPASISCAVLAWFQLQDGAGVGAQFPGVAEFANFIQPRSIYFH